MPRCSWRADHLKDCVCVGERTAFRIVCMRACAYVCVCVRVCVWCVRVCGVITSTVLPRLGSRSLTAAATTTAATAPAISNSNYFLSGGALTPPNQPPIGRRRPRQVGRARRASIGKSSLEETKCCWQMRRWRRSIGKFGCMLHKDGLPTELWVGCWVTTRFASEKAIVLLPQPNQLSKSRALFFVCVSFVDVLPSAHVF